MIQIDYNVAIDNILSYTKNLIEKNKNRNFNLIRVKFFDIFDSSYGTSPRLLNNNELLTFINIPNDDDYNIFQTLIYFQNKIFQETGKRIWGLTFTLYPDGKYEIEYDYNIPEGFNEKGEWIGEQNFGEVTEFFDNMRNIGTDEFELK
ncbi:hypothetical protein [Aliarcobacter butzleri]|uniref:hypothetical protein n=1 Tax=Aliarcobacter butzleri TaxID=28197 RepID=UPI002B23F1C9|nr:hypothetical protein [Aliarcobacter butzleri]